MTTQTPGGSPSGTSQTPFIIRTLALAGLGLGAGIWLSVRLEQRSEQSFPGRLQARMVTIASERPARLQDVRVKPGQRVAAGDTLFVLESPHRDAEITQRQQQLVQREREAQRMKAATALEIHWRRRELQGEIFQTQLRLASLRQEKLHVDVEQVAWREQLSVKTIFSGNEDQKPIFRFLSDANRDTPELRMQAMLKEDEAASAALTLGAQIKLCEQRLTELRTLDEGLEAQIRASHGAADEQPSPASAETAEPAEPELQMTIASPGYGLIGVFQKHPGDEVQAGEVLVQILDDDRRSIEVEIPSWAVVRFQPGQKIRLEFPGAERRTGVISSIPPQTSSSNADPNTDAPVQLVIEPEGKLWPSVPIGSRVLVFQP